MRDGMNSYIVAEKEKVPPIIVITTGVLILGFALGLLYQLLLFLL